MGLRTLGSLLTLPLVANLVLACSSGAPGTGLADSDGDDDDTDTDEDDGEDSSDDGDDTDDGSGSGDTSSDGTADGDERDEGGEADVADVGDDLDTGDSDSGDTGTGDTETDDTGTGDTSTGDTGTDDTGTGDTGTDDEPLCGDDVVEGDEECDGVQLDGKTCETEGFAAGSIACTGECVLDTSGCTMCGNDSIDTPEECDGSDLGANETCADVLLGSDDELLSCTANCTYDYSACSGCGDGVLTSPEQCEPGTPPDLAGESCESQSFDGGTLACTDGCSFDTAGCYVCGDGSIGGPEECDGDNFGESSCATFGFESGQLVCNECAVDSTNCHTCGDDMINGPEVCDGSDLGGATCQNQGFDGGTVVCSAGCELDTDGCYGCGDGNIDPGEDCDDGNYGGATCSDYGYTGGPLTCSSCVIGTEECLLASSLNTIDYNNYSVSGTTYYPLDYMGDEPGYVYIMVPADVTTLNLAFTPRVQTGVSNADRFVVTLRDGGTVVDSCTQTTAGAKCDLGAVDVSSHNGRVLRADIQDYGSNVVLGGFLVEISAATDGLASSLAVTGTWPNQGDSSDYVLWPVGPATDAFSYTWSETTSGTFSVGVMNSSGTDVSQFDASTANTGAWPSSGSPAGWYMMATSMSSTPSVGQSWTFRVTP